MKSVLCFIILLSTICSFHSCDSLILVKISQPVSHYRETMEKGLLASDPFNDLDLRGRKLLCRDVALAKQFAARDFQATRNEERFRTSLSSGRVRSILNEWNITDENLKNYKPSKYTDLRIRVSSENRRVIQGLRCRHLNNIEFFLTYGGKPGCSYLLEPSKNKAHSNDLLVTGIIEPSATLENKNLEYLCNQFETAREAMMSVCDLAMNDKLRLCAAVYDALNSSGLLNISQQNYIRTDLQCSNKTVILEHKRACDTLILPCANVHDRVVSNKIVASLYVLADVCESSAVFVFTPEEGDKVQLLARVTNIAALLHPIKQKRKPKGLIKNANKNDEGESSSYRRKHQIGIKKKDLPPDEVHEQRIHNREERRRRRRQEALEDGAKNKKSANKDKLRPEKRTGKRERKEELEDYYDSVETTSEEDEEMKGDIETEDSEELKEGFDEENDTEKYKSEEIEVTKKKKQNKEEGPTTKTEAYTRDARSNKSGMILRPRERKKDQENIDRSYKSDEEEEKQEAKTDYNDEEYIPTSHSEEISEDDEYQESSPDGDESIHDWELQTDEETHDEASEEAKSSEEGTDTEKDEENYAKQRKGKEPVRVANIHRRHGDGSKELTKRRDIQREREPVFENKNEKEGQRPTTASKTYRGGDSRPKHSSLGLKKKTVQEDEDDNLLNVNKNSEIQRLNIDRGDSPPNPSTVGSSKTRS